MSADTSGNKSVGKQQAEQSVEDSLYAKREKIYPREVHGLFAAMRVAAVVILLGLYYGLAWLSWDGQQLLLFDLPARKFYIFGLVFWPQDFFYLAVMLIIAALALFLFTALAGRLWCGYSCPQTVWTEIFMWMERMVEGGRSAQMKLDKAVMSGRKFRLKFTKHAVWIVFSLWTGFTFVGYFTPIRELTFNVINFELGPWETFWILFYGFATYGNAGWMREQVCIYMCPYARFQSAMFDKDTLIISYDTERGDPRGSRKRSEDPSEKGLGHCIDCTLCVQACPTGIDIRDGLQYECIACAACADACDEVMEKMNYPKGLVRYTTENALAGLPSKFIRPRVIIYIGIIMLVTVALITAMVNRTALDLDVIRDRNALYRETPQGLVQNVYTLRIMNMDQLAHEYTLEVSGIDGISMEYDQQRIYADSGEVIEVVTRVNADPDILELRSTEIRFAIQATDNKDLQFIETARFLGPSPIR